MDDSLSSEPDNSRRIHYPVVPHLVFQIGLNLSIRGPLLTHNSVPPPNPRTHQFYYYAGTVCTCVSSISLAPDPACNAIIHYTEQIMHRLATEDDPLTTRQSWQGFYLTAYAVLS